MSHSFFFHSHNTNQSSPIMTATKNLLSLLTLLTIIHVRSPLYFKAGVEFELVGQKLSQFVLLERRGKSFKKLVLNGAV